MKKEIIQRQGSAIIDDFEHRQARMNIASIREEAERRTRIMHELHDQINAGRSIGQASNLVCMKHGMDKTTLSRWRKKIKSLHPTEWCTALAPQYQGNSNKAAFSDEAWRFIRDEYFIESKPQLSVVYRMAKKKAQLNGWEIPSLKTVERVCKSQPEWLRVLGRHGETAFKAMYPALERDYTTLKIHEGWESDIRRLDVFTLCPDGDVRRLCVVAWRDLRTRLILSIKGYINPCAELVRISFKDAISRANAVPEFVLIDNGREYAAKAVSGGQETRNRGKIKEDDPLGVFTIVGSRAQWATPYHGQAKPIESMWNVLANHIDKTRAFEGAYVGRNAVERPENCRPENAVPLKDLNEIIRQAVDEYNHRPQTASGLNGMSPIQAYQSLIDKTPVRAPTDLMLDQLKKENRSLKIGRNGIEFKLDGYGELRYWSERLADLSRNRPYRVFFNPENPNEPISVWDDKRFLCHAELRESVPFISPEAAQKNARAKAEFLKPRKAIARGMKKTSPTEISEKNAQAGPAQLPQATMFLRDASALPPEPLKAPVAPCDSARESEVRKIYRLGANQVEPPLKVDHIQPERMRALMLDQAKVKKSA